MNTSIGTSYTESAGITLGPCSEAFIWTPPVDVWTLTRWWPSNEEISPQLLIREFLKLTGTSVGRPFLLHAVFLSSEISTLLMSTCGGYRWVCAFYIPNPMHSFRCQNFGHSKQWCASSIMSPICSEHGHSICTHCSTSRSFIHPSCFSFSSQTNTFVQINFSIPAVSCVMVCLQQTLGPLWMSTEMQDLSKPFHSSINYLQHLLTIGSTPDKLTNLIPCCLHCLCFLLMPTPETFCGYHLLQFQKCRLPGRCLLYSNILFFCIYTVVTTAL
jgi:hypothetical protein